MQLMQQFAPSGPLALDPRAFGATFAVGSPIENRVVDGAVLVTVRGPLAARRGGSFDSFDAIVDRVDAALAAKPRAVVLVIDSPGGAAQGCFESSAALRARCTSAGVPLLAFVEGSACSAAYALACAAERIAVRPSSVVGSIGCFDTLASQAGAEAAMGLSYRVVSTGARKLDGNPHLAIGDGAVAAAEAAVGALGDLFFSLVETMRGVPAAQVRALDGALAIGRDAISKQLADVEVSDLSQLLASVSAQSTSQNEPPTKVKTMNEIAKALQAVLDDPNASDEDRAKAKAALAALTASDEPAASSDKDQGGDEGTTAAKALAEVHRLRAEMTRREEETERTTLLASRADFAPELVKVLKTAPLAMVRDMVATLPRSVPSLAAAASVQPTLGEGQGSAQASQLAPAAKAQLDARMNMNPLSFGVKNVGAEQHFGAVVPTKA
ncbi:MAG: S49 family peptidase [Deltaproteobacteria bacterium]|nr:S49 family peptidase [Deltaproteobacteria bacterium]